MLRSIFMLALLVFAASVKSQDTVELRMWTDSAAGAAEDTSRINYLRRLATSFMTSEPERSAGYSRQAIAFSRKIGWEKGEAQNLLNLGAAYSYAAKYDSAILTDGLALAAAKKTGDQNRIALVYINRGTAYTESYEFEAALRDLTQAIKICEATGNKERQARAAASLSEFYVFQDNFKAAMPWAQMAYDLQEELGNPEMQLISRLDLGSLFTKMGKLPEAEKMIFEAMAKSRKMDREDIFVECALTAAEIYTQKEKPDSSIFYLAAALPMARKLGISEREAILCLGIGDAYLRKKAAEPALGFYRRGELCVRDLPSFRKTYSDNLYGEARALAMLGTYREAYEKSELATRIKDSFLLRNQNERVARLQTQFETERREAKISLLQKDKELAGLALQRQKSIRAAIIVLAVLVIGIAALLVARYRVLQRNRQLLQMERLRQAISRDLHDDMGSTLSSIHINSKMALDHSDNPVLVRDRLDKIRTNAGKVMQGMSDIVWAINPANDSLENLLIRMKEFASEVLEPKDIVVDFRQELPGDSPPPGLEKRKEIFMIFKEAVNNAAKYSRAKNVRIGVSTSRQAFRLQVKDDGEGFDPRGGYKGNGLKNMQSRAAGISGALVVDSSPGKGTEVILEMPLP